MPRTVSALTGRCFSATAPAPARAPVGHPARQTGSRPAAGGLGLQNPTSDRGRAQRWSAAAWRGLVGFHAALPLSSGNRKSAGGRRPFPGPMPRWHPMERGEKLSRGQPIGRRLGSDIRRKWVIFDESHAMQKRGGARVARRPGRMPQQRPRSPRLQHALERARGLVSATEQPTSITSPTPSVGSGAARNSRSRRERSSWQASRRRPSRQGGVARDFKRRSLCGPIALLRKHGVRYELVEQHYAGKVRIYDALPAPSR